MQGIFHLFNKYKNHNWFCLSGIFICCFITIGLPILLMGFPDNLSGDFAQHQRFAITYHKAILAGDFSPGWGNDNLGFGSIGIRFYPPLTIYIVALTKILVGNWYDAFWINLFGWMFIGCFGVYYFTKEWTSPSTAMVTGMLYAILPYHLMQIYQYFLFAEFAAAAIIPFCFLFITKICLRQKWVDTFAFATAFGLLLLTHIPSAVITTLSLAVYVLLLMDWTKIKQTSTKLVVAFSISLLTSVFHWIKIITEIPWVAHNKTENFTGYYGYSQWNFPMMLTNHALERLNIAAKLMDSIVILTALLLVAPLVYFLIKRTKRVNSPEQVVMPAITITALFSFFMITKLSSFIWSQFILLQKIQFPWRWLTILSFLALVAFTISLERLIMLKNEHTRLFLYSAISLILAMQIFNWTQNLYFSTPIDRIPFAENIDGLPAKRTAPHWWTVWAKKEAFENTESLSASNRRIEIENWQSENREFSIEVGEPVTARIATFYYPHWKAEINGQKTEVKMNENGAMLIDVPAETAHIRLYFEEPWLIRGALWVSLMTWGLLLSGLFLLYRKTNFVMMVN